MKHLKKLGSVLLALVMVLALAAPAFAATDSNAPTGDTTTDKTINVGTDGKASITINPGEDSNTQGVATTYNYYQLLHASIGADGKTVTYYLNDGADDELRSLLDAVTVDNNDLFTFTQSGTRWLVTLNKKADGTEFTDLDGAAIAAALNTDAIKDKALAKGSFKAGTNGVANSGDLQQGYYLITSSLGTKLVLDTLGHETVTTKNEYITTEKTASKTNMNVGDTVTYTIKVHIPLTANDGDVVTVHDTLDSHLQIKMDTIKATYTPEGGIETDVTLSDGTKKADTETFAKKFTIVADMIGKDVELTYDAELLSTAVDGTGYVNDAFASTPSYETKPSTAKVWTFDFDLDKNFFGAEDDETKIAEFELTDENNNKISFIKDNTGYVKADTDDPDEEKTTVLEVNGKDVMNIRGLAAGTYTLTEIETTAPYNTLKEPITIVIQDTTEETNETPTHKVTYTIGAQTGEGTVTVMNNTGSELPSTGGIGTTIFYIVGGILVLGAVVLLITKRRTSVDDE